MMTVGFSSLGAPALGIGGLSQLAREHHMDFLELRTVEGTIKLPELYQRSPDSFDLHGVPVRVLASDLKLSGAVWADIERFLECTTLADLLGAPYVRVFCGWVEGTMEENIRGMCRTILECRRIMAAQNKKCEMILETHSELSSGKSCLQLIQALEEPIGILWDAHHTWKLEGESPESTWEALSGHIRHIHYKDSFPDSSAKGGFRYVPPGCGDFPSEDLFRLLKTKGYSGGVSLEWEKLWHQDLCELVEVLPSFAAMAKGRSLVSKT